MLPLKLIRFCPRLQLRKLTFRKYCTIKRSIQDILNSEVAENNNNSFVAEGWVKSVRELKTHTFIHVNDGSCIGSLQVVAKPELLESEPHLYGSSVRIEGELVPSVGAGQRVELIASSIKVLGPCPAAEYPFEMKSRAKAEYTRGFPHLRARTNQCSSLLRVRNAASMAVHKYFQENGFLFVHTPILTASDCEGAGEMFSVYPGNDVSKPEDAQTDLKSETEQDAGNKMKTHFFNTPVGLVVSGQLHLETITGAFTKAYNFGPAFRAEKSRTLHHLSEFYMIEAEQAFTEDLNDVIETMEQLVKFTSREVMKTAPEDSQFFYKYVAPKDHQNIIEALTGKPFIRMTYTEAVKILEKKNNKFEFKISWGQDLLKEHECHLVSHCDDTPVFVTDFPARLKPFYSRINTDGKTVASVDLLVPGAGELCGGTMREHNYDVLKQTMDKLGTSVDYDWYLDLRKFGSVPHGGFGMGFERYLQYLLGITHIKDTIPFPRWHESCKL